MKEDIRLIGRVAVDSGMLRVGDPSYEMPYEEEPGNRGVLEHLGEDEGVPVSKAIDFATANGDGIYDVIGVFEDGRLMRVFIEMDVY